MSYKVWYYNHNVILYIDFKTQSYKIYTTKFINVDKSNIHIDEKYDEISCLFCLVCFSKSSTENPGKCQEKTTERFTPRNPI